MTDLLFNDTRLATSHSIKKDQTNHPGEHSETLDDKGAYKFHYTDHTEGVGGKESLNNPTVTLPYSFLDPEVVPAGSRVYTRLSHPFCGAVTKDRARKTTGKFVEKEAKLEENWTGSWKTATGRRKHVVHKQ